MNRRRIGERAAAFVTALISACASTADPLAPREWLEVSVGAALIDRRAPGQLDDALGWRLGGGYDLNLDALRVSWEVDAQWATHDFEDVAAGERTRISAWTVGTGLRLTAHFDALPLSVWARAGAAWRDERPSDALIDDVDGAGFYYGCGLDWRYRSGASIGPMASWFRDDSDGPRRRFIALNARVSL